MHGQTIQSIRISIIKKVYLPHHLEQINKSKLKKLLIIFSFFLCVALNAQNKIVLDPANAKTTINKNIYGHFAEMLGHCIYGGFYVGDNNTKIPNKDGIRLDVVEA